MKESVERIIKRLIFVIVVLALFGGSVYFLNVSAKADRQKRESEIAELKAEIQKWKRRAKEVIEEENKNKEQVINFSINRLNPSKVISIQESGVIIVVKSSKSENLEEWYKTKERAVREIKRVYGGRIKLAAKKHGIDPMIILAVIAVESSGDYRAVSEANAKGLMQLIPPTAKLMGIKDPFHPYENILGGAKYLKQLEKRFGNLDTALAAYNLGPTKVDRLLKNNNFDPSAYIYTRKVNLILAKI